MGNNRLRLRREAPLQFADKYPPAEPNLIKISRQKNPSLNEKGRDGFTNT